MGLTRAFGPGRGRAGSEPPLPRYPNPLTLRERDVLGAAADGATIADIAQRLYLAESTVRNYLSSAIGKTGSRNRIEAVQKARANGWL
jgi:two-component system, NarL family, response regulator DesR